MSGNPPSGAERSGQLTEEAALWFARMRGPEAEAHRAEFDAWLMRGALHRAAYNRASEIFSMGKLLEAERLDALPEPVRERVALERPATGRRVAAFASVATAAVLGGWLITGGDGFPGLRSADRETSAAATVPATYAAMVLETPPGEHRVERLIDGSAVTLGSATRLEVTFGEGKRELLLVRGRARFEVAHEARPFIVSAAGTMVTARGTIFDVAITARKEVTVKLLQGSVDVANASDARAVRRMTPGQSLILAATADAPGAAGPLHRERSREKASQPARLSLREFEGARLADIIAEANRMGGVPIHFSEPSIGEIRVSGRFQIEDTEKLAARSAAIFDLKVDRSDPSRILLEPR